MASRTKHYRELAGYEGGVPSGKVLRPGQVSTVQPPLYEATVLIISNKFR